MVSDFVTVESVYGTADLLTGAVNLVFASF